jgi:hypothetical protein
MIRMTSPELVWHHSVPECALASFRNVILVLCHTGLSVEALRMTVTVNRQLAHEYGHVAVLSHVSTQVSMPTPEVRRVAAESLAATRHTTRAEARVLPGDGFWASAQRGIITAIEMVRPDSVPRKTFRYLREGTTFIGAQLEQNAQFTRELEEAVLKALEVGPGETPPRRGS